LNKNHLLYLFLIKHIKNNDLYQLIMICFAYLKKRKEKKKKEKKGINVYNTKG